MLDHRAAVNQTMYGMTAPDVERWSSRVVVVRGLNPGPFSGPGTNTYLVGTGARPLLIDTGSGVAGYLPLLESALRDEFGNEAPGDILLTHVHVDHISGVAELIKRFGPRNVFKYPYPGADDPYGLELTPLADGEVVETEGATLRAMLTPGHSADHLCFFFEEERALFTGDNVLGVGTAVIPAPGGNLAAYFRSLDVMLGLEPQRVYPGHGPRIDDGAGRIRAYIDHRLEREQQIIAAIKSGAHTIERMVEKIYVDTPRALYPAAGQSVLSHLLKLESERRASRSADPSGEERWTLR
jgi:ribonuclease/clavin/mitogillin